MTNRFQGDPKLLLTESGADLNFISGQPEMDQGFENQAFISLFTAPGWWGNSLLPDADEKIGSDFEETANGAITLQKLNDIKQSAENALKNPAFGNIETTVTNPVSTQLEIITLIQPPGRDIEELRLTRNGENWKNQAAKGLG